MNIKITEDGYLAIERGGEYESQLCPLSAAGADVEMNQCGSWCPHFGEPNTIPTTSGDGISVIEICHGKELFGPIIDERKRENV